MNCEYEARQKALYDYNTLIYEAQEKGKKNEKLSIAKSLLDVLDIETIALKTGLTVEQVNTLKGDA